MSSITRNPRAAIASNKSRDAALNYSEWPKVNHQAVKMAVLKNSARNKTASLTVPDNSWVTFGVSIFSHMSDASDELPVGYIPSVCASSPRLLGSVIIGKGFPSKSSFSYRIEYYCFCC